MLMLDVYDKPFDYLLQVENEYNKIVEKYKIRNEWSGKDKAECDNFISWANRLPYMNIFYHFTK